MKKTINIFLILFSVILLQNCDDEQFEPTLNHVAFGGDTYSTGVDVNGSTTLDVGVFTTTVAGSDTTFNIEVDSGDAAPGSFTVPSTVTIPSGSNKGTISIALTDTNLGIGINKLVLSFTDVATGYDNGAATTVEYIQNCTELTGTLDLVFDRWGSEVSWKIIDSEGGVVTEGGGYSDTGAGTSTSDSIAITLCSGRSYSLETTDGFGDGWGSVGSYTLTIDGEVKVTGNGSLMNNGGSGAATASADFDTL